MINEQLTMINLEKNNETDCEMTTVFETLWNYQR